MENSARAELRHRGAEALPSNDDSPGHVEEESTTMSDLKLVSPEQSGRKLKAFMDVEVALNSLQDVIKSEQWRL